MRDYAKVAPTFWTGETGRQIRAAGSETQVVALYLLTCPSATWTGLFYLPLPTLCHETGSPLEGASKALLCLESLGFARYDHKNELVWVPNTAKFQIGERLKPGDKRIQGIVKDLQQYAKSPFAREFYERYREAFCLPEMQFREAPSKPLRRSFEAPPKPVTEAVAVTETETETRKVPSEPSVRSDSIHESSGPQPVRLAEEPERTGKPPEQEPAIITLPLADKSVYPMTAAQLAELSSLYPGVDPERELLKAKGWLIANPTRRKTRRGIARFIHGWLAKAQDRGNGAKAPPPGRFDACAYLDQKIAEAEAEEHGQSGSD